MRLAAYLAGLYSFVVESLRRADRSFRQSRLKQLERTDGSAQQIVGDVIPQDAVTMALSLSLWHEGMVDHQSTASRWSSLSQRFAASAARQPARERFDELLTKWIGKRPPEGDGRRTFSRRHLGSLLRRHRYPMLNRLNGLRTLVEDATLNARAESELQRACEQLDELLDLDQRYDAPLHFTPMDTGITSALLWQRVRCIEQARELKGQPPPSAEERQRLDHFRRTALHHLRVGEEMYSMRRSFYEVISDLYYLYDDFNDRQIHSKQALQMASTELATLLRRLLDDGRSDGPRANAGRPSTAAGCSLRSRRSRTST